MKKYIYIAGLISPERDSVGDGLFLIGVRLICTFVQGWDGLAGQVDIIYGDG